MLRYCTGFFADCQMLRADLKNQTVPQACVTPPAVGRQARCGPGNNRLAAKRENRPGGRQQHACHTHASNLPASFAFFPAWKLSKPGAIWSSLWWLYPSVQQLRYPCSGKENYLFHVKIGGEEKWQLSVMHVEKIATRGASEESVPCITMSHFCSRMKVSLSGAPGGGDFQRQAMPPEPLRQPREITAGDCTVIKKRDPWNLQWLQSMPVSGFQMSQSFVMSLFNGRDNERTEISKCNWQKAVNNALEKLISSSWIPTPTSLPPLLSSVCSSCTLARERILLIHS